MKRAVLAASLLLLGLMTSAASADVRVEWAGSGFHRLLVRVDPADLGARETDEMPAELPVDLVAELAKRGTGAGGRPDLATLQVMRYDPQTGRPIPYGNLAHARHPADRPAFWYDAAIPYDFPEFSGNIDRTNGRIVREPVVRGGYFSNAIGDGQRGRLAWTHTQAGRQPSWYAIYFSILPPAERASSVPPRGWIGDGSPRFDRHGGSSCAADHCRVDLDDWDGDGLVDLVVGESYGHVLWWPNRGTAERPAFPDCRFLLDADGLPLDAGMGAAPKIVDWDGDGNKDLLVGAEWNRILYYRNAGSNRERKLAYQGLVRADGQTLALPTTPVAQASAAIFQRDYYPVLEAVDWDGDGDADLLAGGYITGRIYFYENTGRGADGQPFLTLRGPLEDERGPINVGDWCAAPCAADFDGDGDLDIISGNMPSGAARSLEQKEADRFLRYFENTGTRRRPALLARSFPKVGTFPRAGLATPRADDWDGDGDLDLVVSARENLYLYENIGTRIAPRFDVHAKPLPARWGNAPLAVDQFRDWDGDGRLDLVSGYTVRLNSGQGNPWSWDRTVMVLPPGEHIAHPSGLGDDWFWPYLDDFDGDGRIDVLFGDWHGHVWFHRNLSTPERPHFDTLGLRLRLKGGAELKVGPVGKDIHRDFDALQGARTVFTAADFDRDGRRDLVVGDTYGIVRFFRNVGTPSAPLFADPIEIGNLGIRLLVSATDWDRDGWLDVIGGAANGRVRLFLNTGGKSERPFDAGRDLDLPPIPQPRVLVADLNGDGDDDLFFPSTQGSCLVERSFLAHGYARGVLLAVETR